ncbi:MAG: cardiolipin synthase [Phycisphaerales bacterium]
MFGTLYLISEWIIRIVMVPVATRRRQPVGALAWLAVIFALPWLGLVVYLLFAGTGLGRQRAKRHAAVVEAMKSVDRLALTRDFAVRPEIAAEHQALINVAMNMAGRPILSGHSADLIADTDVMIERLIADIDAAEHHVHLLFYIYRDDATGRRVAEALALAERRGVQCRVLVDAAGSRRLIGALPRFFAANKIEFHRVLPVNPIRSRLARVDLRNHRKLAVIDGRIAYTGSQNIVDANYGHDDLAWHDLMVRLTGPAVTHLQTVFLEDWYSTTDDVLEDPAMIRVPALPGEGDVSVQVVPSGPIYPTDALQNLVVQAIHSAQRRLILTSPYFVPDEPALLALKVAVMRGARVDLVVPAGCDHPVVTAAGRAYFDELLEAGVNIHLYRDGLLHSKTMTVDDAFAMIGSANFDIRSFNLNFELNLLLYGPAITAKLRFLQQQYIEQSDALTLASWRRRAGWRTMIDNAAKLLSPIL